MEKRRVAVRDTTGIGLILLHRPLRSLVQAAQEARNEILRSKRGVRSLTSQSRHHLKVRISISKLLLLLQKDLRLQD